MAKTHADNVEGRLRNHIFNYIGNRPIVVDITASELLAMLRRIEAVGHYETAHRVRSVCGQVSRYAIVVTGRAQRDPSVDLKGAFISVKTTSFAALTEPKDIARITSGY